MYVLYLFVCEKIFKAEYIYIYIYIFCTDPATDIYQGMPALGCHERT